MARCLGKPVRQLDIVEIGGGLQMERARYEGTNNQVTAMDLDVIPWGFDLGSYLRMFQENGFGRLAKTVGRKLLLVDRGKQLTWEKALGITNLPAPTFIQGDICHAIPKSEAYGIVVSWSTFEHLSEPKIALQNAILSLRAQAGMISNPRFIVWRKGESRGLQIIRAIFIFLTPSLLSTVNSQQCGRCSRNRYYRFSSAFLGASARIK